MEEKALSPSKKIASTIIEIELLCCCNVPNVPGVGSWIACDKCKKWNLKKCENIDGNKFSRDIHVCKSYCK